jgi:hypothetical protein
VDRACELLGWMLVSVVAPLCSIHAVETPGGDDDRQWLSFWLIFTAVQALERFTSVLLSRLPGYYPAKLLFFLWLVLFGGAGRLYDAAHAELSGLHRMLRRAYLARPRVRRALDAVALGPLLFGRGPPSEEEHVRQLELAAALGSLELVVADARSLGLEALYRSLASPAAIIEQYDERVLFALVHARAPPRPAARALEPAPAAPPGALTAGGAGQMRKWGEQEARFLQVQLKGASDLPVMDFGLLDGRPGLCDPYAVLFLVPPPAAYHSDMSGEATPPSLQRAITRTPTPRRPSKDSRLGRALRYMRTERNLLWSSMGIGPVGSLGQYHKTVSSTQYKTLEPVWDETLELGLKGGHTDEDGRYVNVDAPFTSLRVELWDHDRLSNDDFIGECSIPLSLLMDGRIHVRPPPSPPPARPAPAPRIRARVRRPRGARG